MNTPGQAAAVPVTANTLKIEPANAPAIIGIPAAIANAVWLPNLVLVSNPLTNPSANLTVACVSPVTGYYCCWVGRYFLK